MKFKVGDTVSYTTYGICKVDSQIKRKSLGSSVETECYVLKPVSDNKSTIYVPINNQELLGKIKKILSAKEIYNLIEAMPDENTIWIEDKNERFQTYKTIIDRGDRGELIKLIKTLYLKKQEQKELGKRLHATDESFLKNAERILHGEFAHVLGIDTKEVIPLITQQLG